MAAASADFSYAVNAIFKRLNWSSQRVMATSNILRDYFSFRGCRKGKRMPHTINEGTYTLVLEGETVLPSVIVRLRKMVADARRLTNQAVRLAGQSQHVAFKICMNAYFRVPPVVNTAKYVGWVVRVNRNIQTLATHLNSRELTVHAAVGQHAGMEDAAAYVQKSTRSAFLDAIYPNPNSPATFRGDIYMKFNQLGGANVATANLIHEATHRYLGTRDWAYVANYDMIAFEKSYRDINLPVPYPPRSVNALVAWADMTVDQAINNADSYAGFISRLRVPLDP
jgi:hypothetical protein